jgi:protein subunit release factor A
MINPKHIEVTSINSPDIGGQQTGVIEAGVRVVHLPTQISAACRNHRSQHQNLKVALSMIEWGLAEVGWKE